MIYLRVFLSQSLQFYTFILEIKSYIFQFNEGKAVSKFKCDQQQFNKHFKLLQKVSESDSDLNKIIYIKKIVHIQPLKDKNLIIILMSNNSLIEICISTLNSSVNINYCNFNVTYVNFIKL